MMIVPRWTRRLVRGLLLIALSLALAEPSTAATVTANTDAGAGSLRQALADANDGDTIDFALTTPATITLTTGELVVGKSVVITGPGVDQLTVDGNGRVPGLPRRGVCKR